MSLYRCYLNCVGGAANSAPPCLDATREGANPNSFWIFCLQREK